MRKKKSFIPLVFPLQNPLSIVDIASCKLVQWKVIFPVGDRHLTARIKFVGYIHSMSVGCLAWSLLQVWLVKLVSVWGRDRKLISASMSCTRHTWHLQVFALEYHLVVLMVTDSKQHLIDQNGIHLTGYEGWCDVAVLAWHPAIYFTPRRDGLNDGFSRPLRWWASKIGWIWQWRRIVSKAK